MSKVPVNGKIQGAIDLVRKKAVYVGHEILTMQRPNGTIKRVPHTTVETYMDANGREVANYNAATDIFTVFDERMTCMSPRRISMIDYRFVLVENETCWLNSPKKSTAFMERKIS